ncbi:hypothetical protein Y032_0007g3409 [Ancylostoma ceylanicum]|uniref:Uncharacterized protein n=1 Tax=Ancylostoma ceylanicum TaxID=53326 RepID=A0A016VPR6_9BILA|nr:hypothetical protein Y032_0007g3409 [Ancylostoma ceylanicum]
MVDKKKCRTNSQWYEVQHSMIYQCQRSERSWLGPKLRGASRSFLSPCVHDSSGWSYMPGVIPPFSVISSFHL